MIHGKALKNGGSGSGSGDVFKTLSIAFRRSKEQGRLFRHSPQTAGRAVSQGSKSTEDKEDAIDSRSVKASVDGCMCLQQLRCRR